MKPKLVFTYVMCIVLLSTVALMYIVYGLDTWHQPLPNIRHNGTTARPAHPNVLLLVADDLRPAFSNFKKPKMEFLLNPEMHTPNVVKLASRSLTLGQAYCQYSSCGPSRASAFTGRRPDTIRTYDNNLSFRERGKFNTVFQYFKENGYHTLSIGKVCHYISHSKFQTDYPSWSEDAIYPKGRSLNSYWKKETRAWRPVHAAERNSHPLPDEVVTEEALSKLRQLSAGNFSKPLFLAVGFTQPHMPVVFPEEFLAYYPLESVPFPANPDIPEGYPETAVRNPGKHGFKCFLREARKSQKFRRAQHLCNTVNYTGNANLFRQSYFASISYVDQLIGRILGALDDLGLEKDTIVLLMSDHGFMMGENGLWNKYSTLDLANKVPLMIRIPGVTDSGLYSDGLVELIDVFPSLVEAAGLPAVPQCPRYQPQPELCHEGTSFLPLIQNPTRRWKPAVFSQIFRPGWLAMGYSVRTGNHRYTEWIKVAEEPKGEPNWKRLLDCELYDHLADPLETTNCAQNPQYESLRKNLSTLLHKGWRKALPRNE